MVELCSVAEIEDPDCVSVQLFLHLLELSRLFHNPFMSVSCLVAEMQLK
jgi:hypothetical protein